MAALFVYGTLMVDQPAHGLLAPWVRGVRPGVLDGELYLMPAGYPALVDRPGAVHGEVLDLAEGAPWPQIDAYEGHDPADREGSLYDRVTRPVRAGKETRTAWVYLMPAAWVDRIVAQGARRILTGAWPPRNPSDLAP